MAGRVTIVDVANAAGYSVATVSRALRGFDNVSPTAMTRVTEIAAELGYRPSHLATQLRSGTTRAVIVMVPAIDNWYFSELMAGAEAYLSEEGYDTFVSVVADDDALERVLAKVGPRGRVDGVLVADLAIEPSTNDMLDALGIPVVLAGVESAEFSSAAVDDEQVGYQATRHLLELGHTRIGVVRGRSHAVNRVASPARRVHGYHAALREAGIEPDPELELEVEFSVAGGAEAASLLVTELHQPTALFCTSDLIALGVTNVLGQLGYTLPDDMSIVGVDDHEMAGVLGLTTIRQPVSGIGAASARLLLDALADPARREQVRLATELVIRDSTTALRPRPHR
jgi:LacI family repressor for deo operon, udp, cdd, tsx, nupC, and nupG